MAYRATPHLLVEQVGAVTRLTLNNPEKRNCFVDDMHAAMQDIWADLEGDAAVRAVVVTGAGSAFSAGGDIPEFVRQVEDLDYRRASLGGARRMMDAMAGFPKPVVAAVNGPAVGLGCSVALLCDVVYMAESSFLCDPHVNVGLVCGDGGAVVWPLLTSLLKAKEYLLTGDRIPAAEAVALGLANRVVPDGQVVDAAMSLAERLAAQPARAVQDTKRALNLHLQAAVQQVAAFALAAESETFSSDEVRATIARWSG